MELNHYLSQKNFNVLCFSEIWSCKEQLKYVNLNNYKLATYYTRKNHIHGGVAIYVSNNLEFKSYPFAENLCEDIHFEISAIELRKYNSLIACCYRSPVGDTEIFNNKLTAFLGNVHDKKIILCGDFNTDFSKNVVCQNLLNLFISFGMHECVKQMTRVTTRSQTRIDNIFTNIDIAGWDTKVTDPYLSDHKGIIMTYSVIDGPQVESAAHMLRIVNNLTITNYKIALTICDWSFLFQSNDANYVSNILLNNIIKCYNASFPQKKKIMHRYNKRLIRYSEEIRIMKNRLITLHDLTKTNENFKELYKIHKKEYKNALRSEVIKYNTNQILNSNNKQKTAWSIINQNKTKHNVGTEISEEDLNTFFINIADKIVNILNHDNKSYLESLRKNRVSFSFYLSPVTEIEVETLIDSLSSSKSRDYFGLNSDSLKLAKKELLTQITYFINQCFENGIYPENLKHSKVTPIFKKGDKNLVENYRPISIIPILGKILELAYKIRLMDYFESKHLINPYQFGYRKGKSTVEALTNIIISVTDELEKGNMSSTSFIDLSKAFDCVSHDILLLKLETYGIRGLALSFIESYISDRYQCVQVNGKTSSLKRLKYGVPQGSILGPILFIIYINDIADFIEFKSVEYADDTTLLSSSKDISNLMHMRDEMQSMAKEYFNNNKLSLNTEKTQHLIFNLNTHIQYNENPVKCLGVFLDCKLTWEPHINYVSKKLSSCVYLLRNLTNLINPDIVVHAYHALFHSVMTYGLLLWGASAHASRILLIQKRAVRVITNSKYNESCRPLFKKLGILTVTNQYIYVCLSHAKKYHTTNQNPNRNETRLNLLIVPYFRLTKNINSFRYNSIKFYNLLPTEWKKLSYSKFQKTIKLFLRNNVFYELQEFIDHFRRPF